MEKGAPPGSIWQWKPCEYNAFWFRKTLRYDNAMGLTEVLLFRADDLNFKDVPTVIDSVLVTERAALADQKKAV